MDQGEGILSLRCWSPQSHALHQPLDTDHVRSEVRYLSQDTSHLRSKVWFVNAVDHVTDTLHQLSQSHSSSELENPSKLNLLRVSET